MKSKNNIVQNALNSVACNAVGNVASGLKKASDVLYRVEDMLRTAQFIIQDAVVEMVGPEKPQGKDAERLRYICASHKKITGMTSEVRTLAQGIGGVAVTLK